MTRGAGLAALLLLVLACRTPQGLPLLPVLGEDARLRAWLARANEDTSARLAVRAIGHMKLEGPRGSARVRQVIVAERPARLRLESLNFLGQTANVLVTDGERYAFYDGSAIERGGVTPDLLQRYLGLDLAAQEAVTLLVAGPRLPEGAPEGVLGRGDERVAVFASERVHFDAAGELRQVESLDASGRVRWRAEYDRWREVPGGRYPYAMTFTFPASDLRAEFELDEVELNPAIDAALFSLPLEARE